MTQEFSLFQKVAFKKVADSSGYFIPPEPLTFSGFIPSFNKANYLDLCSNTTAFIISSIKCNPQNIINIPQCKADAEIRLHNHKL